jgi:hypothetical protein
MLNGSLSAIVAHALLRAASSLYSTPVRQGEACVETSLDAARKSAYATFSGGPPC